MTARGEGGEERGTCVPGHRRTRVRTYSRRLQSTRVTLGEDKPVLPPHTSRPAPSAALLPTLPACDHLRSSVSPYICAVVEWTWNGPSEGRQ